MSSRKYIFTAVAAVTALWGATLPEQSFAAAPIKLQVSEGTSIAAALSPDRTLIVFDLQGILYKLPVVGGAATPITDALYDARQPTFSADGKQVAFQSNRDGHWKIWIIGIDGKNARPLSDGPFDEREPSWSPDGKSIAFTSSRNGRYDIWARSVADGSLRQLTFGDGGNSRPTWSPDGKQIAYLSERRGGTGIYVADVSSAGSQKGEGNSERSAGAFRLSGGPSIAPAGVPTWTPDGKDVLYVKFDGAQAKLMRGNDLLLEGEDLHPFRMQWLSEREYLYTSDGKIKRRSLDGGEAKIIPFTAPLEVRRADDYRKRVQDLKSTAAQPVRGVQRAVLSPEGKRIALTALGGLWVMDIGGEPRRLTAEGPYAVVDPAWSPDGTHIAYSTDRGGSLDIWSIELASGNTTRITNAPGAEMRPAYSPDGSKLAYLDVFGGYQEVLHVRDLSSGDDKVIDAAGQSPGFPAWFPDGRSLLVSTFRSWSSTQSYLIGGDNQAAIVPIDGGKAQALNLVPGRSIGNRSGDGPGLSPDGKLFVYQLESALWVQSTEQKNGEFEKPRKLADLITTGQSWSADSQQLLVNAGSIMHLFDMKTGRSKRVPFNLKWNRYHSTETVTIHAGLLVDGVAETARADVDIVVADGRIRSIQPHGAKPPQGRFVDASKLTVMPGLMDTHEHLIKQFGATYGLLNLAYGITTVRSPGNVPGDVLEEKEALASGQRPGPNMFVTGYILDGEQTMWEMSTSVMSIAEVRPQIDLARDLDYDVIKTYMHTSEPVRAEIVKQAHRVGIPVTGHDIYPAAYMGLDSSEHLFVAGSGRGYSSKVSNLQHVYDDVIQMLAKSGLTNAPTLSLFTPSAEFIDHDPTIADARWQLQPVWVRKGPKFSSGDVNGGDEMLANVRKSMAKMHAAGVRFVVGTDTPLKTAGISTQNELVQMAKAGISPYHALRAATVVPAEMLGVANDLGTVEAGKIADLVFVEGNPLSDIRNASKVRQVMKSGRLYSIEELTTFPVASGVAASR